MKVSTEHSRWGWTAVDLETYGGPPDPIGIGKTEQEATADLLEQIDARQPDAS